MKNLNNNSNSLSCIYTSANSLGGGGAEPHLAFTLAEVLITLGIIGVVAAMTLPSLVTNIQNKGFAERLIKTYSILQQVTDAIIAESGEPVYWEWSAYRDNTNSSGNNSIAEMYKKHLSIVKDCGKSYHGCEKPYNIPYYKYLNGGDKALGIYPGVDHYPFYDSDTFILKDEVLIGIHFKESSGGMRWGAPQMYFAVDVNGIRKGPNKVGRDLFFLYMDKEKKGKIKPYTNEAFLDGGVDYRNTCEKDQKGFSCAYRIITEGKMNY